MVFDQTRAKKGEPKDNYIALMKNLSTAPSILPSMGSDLRTGSGPPALHPGGCTGAADSRSPDHGVSPFTRARRKRQTGCWNTRRSGQFAGEASRAEDRVQKQPAKKAVKREHAKK
jgi:hypothetical protein